MTAKAAISMNVRVNGIPSRRIFDFLASARLAIVLLAALAGSYAICSVDWSRRETS